ncbi:MULTISPECIES: hypothetical protein [Tatumella]|uniref:Uncharacterized protein n=1 Tax=Tatumella punctata TaxID=399969 RepID=A0ABW1VT37_9GAMM|nr:MULTISPECIES: hypothetical protein [unclassified Tatumella]MBS0855870.1 hypothetical protein [Tatumella sp. JGM16]MBS0895306.1 hypothetical protein [Tatumella sp. JGM130]MBS0912833.1 hypothetical protein [Tatumella sp. JGM91]
MKFPHLLLLSSCFFPLTVTEAAAKRSAFTAKIQAVIFLNSEIPESNRLSREINQQLYLSTTLARKLEVTMIDINPSGYLRSGPARYLKDPAGIWVAKYRPVAVPALFCIQGSRRISYNLTTAEDIRKCL